MNRSVTSFIFILMFICVTAFGGRKPLKGDELTSIEVMSAAKFAANEIRSQKLRNGELNECEQLSYNILRGYKQIVSGDKYMLELKVFPVPNNDEFCANKLNKSFTQFKPEICEIDVWSRPWKIPHSLELVRSTCLKIED